MNTPEIKKTENGYHINVGRFVFDVRSECCYVQLNDFTVCIDDSTNEQIVSKWENGTGGAKEWIEFEGVLEPAWKHEDGTLVSFWNAFSALLISDSDGVRRISHSDAESFGYTR